MCDSQDAYVTMSVLHSNGLYSKQSFLSQVGRRTSDSVTFALVASRRLGFISISCIFSQLPKVLTKVSMHVSQFHPLFAKCNGHTVSEIRTGIRDQDILLV
jgi:hypothetical protein